MADATALSCVQTFITTRTAELLRCGGALRPGGDAAGASSADAALSLQPQGAPSCTVLSYRIARCGAVSFRVASRQRHRSSLTLPPVGSGLRRGTWKFALHKVTSFAALAAAPGTSTFELANSGVTLGLGELASAFAVLDSMDVSDDAIISVTDFVSAIERQRSLVMSLISNTLVSSAPSS
jgi:hypothetical protein